jgi:hypothetical protein
MSPLLKSELNENTFRLSLNLCPKLLFVKLAPEVWGLMPEAIKGAASIDFITCLLDDSIFFIGIPYPIRCKGC